MKSETIDMTPEGCKTAEGAERVQKAMDAFAHSQAEMANAAAAFVRRYNGIKLPEYVRAEWAELIALAGEQRERQNDFLCAVIGSAPRVSPDGGGSAVNPVGCVLRA